MDRRTLSIIIILTAVVVSSALAVRMLRRDVWFEDILSSEGSGYEGEEPMYLVIRDENEWSEVWGLATSPYYPPKELPKIDFSKHMVIAVFQGVRGGPAEIRIEGITRDWGGDLVVKVVHYGGPIYPLPAVYSPFHMVKIERTDAGIRFETVKKPHPLVSGARR